jgi:hypothetical protein
MGDPDLSTLEVCAAVPAEAGIPASEPTAGPGRADRVNARGRYRQSRQAYAEMYGTTPRSIGNWIRHGGLKGEFPPLDDPSGMVSWWGSHMEHRVPDKIYAAAKSDPTADPQQVGMVCSGKDDLFASGTDSVNVGENEEVLSTGFLASLLRTRTEEAKAHRRYHLAVEEVPPDEGKIRVLQKTWQDLADHLRALEKAAPEVLRKSGDMWLGVDIVRELAEIHGVIGSGVRTLGRRWAVKMGVAWTIADDRAFQDEVDRLFARLHASKFSACE